MTTTWLDSEDYVSEQQSVPAALSALGAAVSRASKLRRNQRNQQTSTCVLAPRA
jgi:hypothetical protein